MNLLRRRPALTIVLVTVVVAIIGTIFSDGVNFIVTPIPVPRRVAGTAMTLNLLLAVICMVLVYTNLHRYEERWTWQERAFSRGTFLLIFAGVLGYLARAFTAQASVTLGTPVYTIAALWIIYASVRSPERFDREDAQPQMEHEQIQQYLDQMAQNFKLFIDQVVDYAIFATSLDGTILTWNAGAERLKGYTAQEAIGENIEMFYGAPERRIGLPKKLLEIAKRRGSVERTGWRVRKDGTQFWADVVITLVRDQDGKPIGFVKVTRDLTNVPNRTPESEVKI